MKPFTNLLLMSTMWSWQTQLIVSYWILFTVLFNLEAQSIKRLLSADESRQLLLHLESEKSTVELERYHARSIKWFTFQPWCTSWNLHHYTTGISSDWQVCSAIIDNTSCISRGETMTLTSKSLLAQTCQV